MRNKENVFENWEDDFAKENPDLFNSYNGIDEYEDAYIDAYDEPIPTFEYSESGVVEVPDPVEEIEDGEEASLTVDEIINNEKFKGIRIIDEENQEIDLFQYKNRDVWKIELNGKSANIRNEDCLERKDKIVNVLENIDITSNDAIRDDNGNYVLVINTNTINEIANQTFEEMYNYGRSEYEKVKEASKEKIKEALEQVSPDSKGNLKEILELSESPYRTWQDAGEIVNEYCTRVEYKPTVEDLETINKNDLRSMYEFEKYSWNEEHINYDALIDLSQLNKADLLDNKNLETVIEALERAAIHGDTGNQTITIYDSENKSIAASITTSIDDNGRVYYSINEKPTRLMNNDIDQSYNIALFKRDLENSLKTSGQNLILSCEAIQNSLEPKKANREEGVEGLINDDEIEKITENIVNEFDKVQNDKIIDAVNDVHEKYSDIIEDIDASEFSETTISNMELMADEIKENLDKGYIVSFNEEKNTISIAHESDPSAVISLNNKGETFIYADAEKDISKQKETAKIARNLADNRKYTQKEHDELLKNYGTIGKINSFELLENACMEPIAVFDGMGNSVLFINVHENESGVPELSLKSSKKIGGYEENIDLSKYGYDSINDILKDVSRGTFCGTADSLSEIAKEYSKFTKNLEAILSSQNIEVYSINPDGKKERVEKEAKISRQVFKEIKNQLKDLENIDRSCVKPILDAIGSSQNKRGVSFYNEGILSGIEFNLSKNSIPPIGLINGFFVKTDAAYEAALTDAEKKWTNDTINRSQIKDPFINKNEVKAECYKILRPELTERIELNKNMAEYCYNIERSCKEFLESKENKDGELSRANTRKLAEALRIKSDLMKDMGVWQKMGFGIRSKLEKLKYKLYIATDKIARGAMDSVITKTIIKDVKELVKLTADFAKHGFDLIDRGVGGVAHLGISAKDKVFRIGENTKENVSDKIKSMKSLTDRMSKSVDVIDVTQNKVRNIAETINDSFATMKVDRGEFIKMLPEQCFYEVYEFKLEKLNELKKIPKEERTEKDQTKIEEYSKALKAKEKIDYIAKGVNDTIENIREMRLNKAQYIGEIAKSIRNMEASYNVKNGIEAKTFKSLDKKDKDCYTFIAEKVFDQSNIEIGKEKEVERKEMAREDVR